MTKVTHNLKSRNVFAFLLTILLGGFILSCQEENAPDLEQLRNARLAFLRDSLSLADSLAKIKAAEKFKYFRDSLKLRDSLAKVNGAGTINYTITVVNGSTSSVAQGRTSEAQSVISGAEVTISQFGKTEKLTTNDAGMVIFNGFFRTQVSIYVKKQGFTTATFNAAVGNTATPNGTITFVGNILPIFETTGNNVATISGLATLHTDLTNKTRELVPDGTKLIASIDVRDPNFINNYLKPANVTNASNQSYVVGDIKQVAYETGLSTSTKAGAYSLTVPASIDGLPVQVSYSDIVANQLIHENNGARVTKTYRTIFPGDNTATRSSIPAGTSVVVSFNAGSGATASTNVASPGTVRVNVLNGGSGYSGTPALSFSGGGGSGAAGTAVVTNGTITGVTLTSGGGGYTSAPTVTVVNGTGATASVQSLSGTEKVLGVRITNSGLGYTAAPTVTFSAPTGANPVTATGTANIDAQGRVTSVNITNQGSGYTSAPTVTFSAAPAGGTSAQGVANMSGQSIGIVQVTAGGSNYTYPPNIVFGTPQLASGTSAAGIGVIDPVSKQLVGITITDPGSGYTSTPSITISNGSNASFQAALSGGPIVSASITNQGSKYIAVPKVVITGDGSGATATAVVVDGKVVGINITNGGSGYTQANTSLTIVSGSGAAGTAIVSNGAVTGVTIDNGGTNYDSAPEVTFSAGGGGSGATGTATVSGGKVTGVTITTGGSGYQDGNTPGTAEGFSTTKGGGFSTKSTMIYVNDVHYGTGIRQPN